MEKTSWRVGASAASLTYSLTAVAEESAYQAFQALRSAGLSDECVATRLALEVVFEVILKTVADGGGLVTEGWLVASSIDNFAGTIPQKVLSPKQLDRLHEVVSAIPSERVVDEVSVAFESLYGRAGSDFDIDGLRSSSKRKDNGVFFTPPELAAFVTENALSPVLASATSDKDIMDLRILDPAVGTGVFLLNALRLIRAALLTRDPTCSFKDAGVAASQCLHGVDRDGFAARVARACLWIEIGSNDFQPENLESKVLIGDSLSGPSPTNSFQHSIRDPEVSPEAQGIVWSDAFPHVFGSELRTRGFDLILSNPPWGAIKPTLREFFRHLDERVSGYQGNALRKFLEAEGHLTENGAAGQLWEEYAETTKSYARSLRNDSSFQHQRIILDGRATGGDADLYKYFLERCHQLLTVDGRAGFVLPSGFHRAEGAAGIRQLFLNSGEFEFFLEFENRKKIFPIHGMYRFALAVFQRGSSTGVRNVAYQLESVQQARSVLEAPSDTIAFSRPFLKHVSGHLVAFPEVRSQAELRLLRKLHSQHPPLGSRSSDDWNVSFVRELDMTNDSNMFVDSRTFDHAKTTLNADGSLVSKGRVFLPVLEGRMVHQFTCGAKGYRGGEARTAKWVWLDPGSMELQPHYFVEADDAARILREITLPRVGYCDVTGHANERSVLAALIPPSAVCGNKVPTCRFDRTDFRLHLIWLAIANSFVIDWLVRRRISTTLNFFHWKQIPFPRVSPDSELGQELCDLAAILSFLPSEALRGGGDAHNKRLLATRLDLSARGDLRVRIDVIVAELFNLTLAEFELILGDFPLLDRYQPWSSDYGPAERGVTQSAVLAAFQGSKGGGQCEPTTILEMQTARHGSLSHGIVPYIPSEQAREALVGSANPRRGSQPLPLKGA